jgi:hypothetical protein
MNLECLRFDFEILENILQKFPNWHFPWSRPNGTISIFA